MKTRLFVIVTLLCSLLLAACGPTTSAEKTAEPSASGAVDANGHVTLDFWYSLSGDTGAAVETLVKQFNDSQTKITVKATYQGNYSDIMAKIYSAIAGGTVPNVAQAGGAPLLGTSGAILPMTDFVSGENGFDLSQIHKAFIDYNTVNGVLWSMPFNNSVPVMYYNKDLFKAAGLDPENPPQNFDELIAVAKRLTLDPNNTGAPTQYGLNTRDDTHWYLDTMFLENGSAIVKDDLSEVLYNNPQAVEMLTLWGDLVKTDKVMPSNQHSEAQTDFLAGKLGMLFGSSASVNTIQKSATFDLGVAMFPKIGDNERSLPIGGGSLTIFKNDNESVRNASWEFIKFMTSKESSIYLTQQTGYLPIYQGALDWPEIQQLIKDEPVREAGIQSLDYAVAIPVFSALGNSDLALRQAIEKVELGAAEPADALNLAVESVNRSIKEQFSN
ncbi:ABC-type sugar transport system, periplasmic component [Longilinea arvoryzae]|uniref:ABC-type sugar transport system, periplasmic component n=1 Tax=Longilinea arvoryzae TaxID=360412 RepID=A0A0S7BHM8_9CHLR|nr:ABC transporter substrate-binding protein [Longilinea arvoryzae]GAP13990.1 ABC-type sugar transport system, periplasmic component [Longilinea arvoryzae]